MKKEIVIRKTIVPTRAFYKRKLHKLINIKSECVVKSYKVVTQDNKILKIILESYHPNVDPTTHEFCLPKTLLNSEFDQKAKKEIEFMIRNYNLDDCYYRQFSYFGLKEEVK